VIPHVPPGRYYLRVEPEMEGSQTPSATPAPAPASSPTTTTPQRLPNGRFALPPRQPPVRSAKSVAYEIVLRHDVPSYGWFWLAAFLLLIPPIFSTIRAASFENRRWSTSDYPPTSGGG
jgi:hypothetical protein